MSLFIYKALFNPSLVQVPLHSSLMPRYLLTPMSKLNLCRMHTFVASIDPGSFLEAQQPTDVFV